MYFLVDNDIIDYEGLFDKKWRHVSCHVFTIIPQSDFIKTLDSVSSFCYCRNYSHWWQCWWCPYLRGADPRGRDNLHAALATSGKAGAHPGGAGGVRGGRGLRHRQHLRHLRRRGLDPLTHPCCGAAAASELGQLSGRRPSSRR